MVTLRGEATRLAQYVVDIRRELHRFPEPGNGEIKTAEIIRRELTRMGIEHESPCNTAVVGIIRGELPVLSGKVGEPEPAPVRCVALRAELDGLPIAETGNCPFASLRPHWMHACGHDAHMAILLGTAQLLKKFASLLCGNVVLLFQPAEETTGGARELVRAGCLRGVDAVAGLHVDPLLPCGHVQTKSGALYGGSDSVRIVVHGAAAHGAYPETGTDALVAAAQLVSALQTVASRNVSPFDPVALTLGTVKGGSAPNILAAEVELTGTLRTAEEGARNTAKRRIDELTRGVCAAFGARGEVTFEPGYPPLVNDGALTALFFGTAQDVLGGECVREMPHGRLGVDDFAFLSREVPGVFFHLGCANKEKGIGSPLHSPTFAIDEDCLPIGVLTEAALVLRLLRSGREEQADWEGK